ncbi:MAG TPA: hypothetical protein PJ995_21520 [Cyclobacteriaceae bacterium]|nr:hypothetical protein [Cyclobacteriaceae bacterium]HMX02931.1 hypothetical protein [Cyclobacteriaceae bacterium]
MKFKGTIITQLQQGTINRALIEVRSTDESMAVSGSIVITSKKKLPQTKKDIIIEIPEK